MGKENGGKGDRRGRGQGQGQSREVLVSKALSNLLRHAAEKEGIKMNSQGYANVADVLQWRKLKSLKATFDEIRHAVDSSDKKRFALLHIPSSQNSDLSEPSMAVPTTAKNETAAAVTEPTTTEEQSSTTEQALAATDADPSHFLIRATQGHSMKSVDASSFLEPLSLADETKLPETVVHGTFYGAWPAILQSGGLQHMSRHHVHFATGPSAESVLGSTEARSGDAKGASTEKTVISGMRWDAQILIYINLRKALEAGCPFWRSENGVILSEGLPHPKKDVKVVSVDFFDVVIERKAGLGKIWEGGKELQELPAHLAKKGTKR